MSGRKTGFSGKLLLTLSIACLFLFTQPVFGGMRVFAKTRFLMTASVGINGYYDANHLVPVILHIANAGAASDGVLEVKLPSSGSGNAVSDGDLQYPIRIHARGATKASIVVPGSVVADAESVSLVVGQETVASTVLSGNSLGQVALVEVVSNRLQGAQFLAGSIDPVHQEPVLAERISPDKVPGSADWLDGITAVTVDPDVLKQFTTAQRNALKSWVQLGGLLVVTGLSDKLSAWDSVLPLRQGAGKTVSTQPLLDFAGTSNAIPGNSIRSSAAALSKYSQDEVWAGTNAHPLIAAQSYGRGTVVQTAFSPLTPALLSWSGNASLWNTVLQKGLKNSVNSLPSLTGTGGTLALSSASDALSPMRVPSLKFWGPLFATYVIAIGPVLFLLLRKYRREPMAWWILPIASIVTTAGIYGFGAIQRPHGVLAETVGMMEFTGNGNAEVYGVTGFTSPYETDAQLSSSGSGFILPMAPKQNSENGAAVAYIDNDASASFSGIGRWNLRYLYSQGIVSGEGKMTGEFDVSSESFTGFVRNETSLQLHDVAVLWRGKLYELGDLKPGDTEVVTSDTKYRTVRGNWLSEYGQYNGDITHGLGRSLGSYLATNDSGSQNQDNRVMIVATSSGSKHSPKGLPEIHTIQKIISNENLVFVRQYMSVQEDNPSEETQSSNFNGAFHYKNRNPLSSGTPGGTQG